MTSPALTKLNLPDKTPRDLDRIPFPVSLRRGLRTGLYFPFFFFAASALSLAGAFYLPLPEPGVRVFMGLFGTVLFFGLGLLVYLPTRTRLKSRLSALQNGRLQPGQVVRHGRMFVPWKSLRDHTLEVMVTLDDGSRKTHTVQTPGSYLQRSFPVGAEIQALVDRGTGAVFCPAVLGLEIQSER